MRPAGVRVLRRERRRAWKGIPRGRRATHQAVAVWGQQHDLAAARAAHTAFCAERRAQLLQEEA